VTNLRSPIYVIILLPRFSAVSYKQKGDSLRDIIKGIGHYNDKACIPKATFESAMFL
jgi:hypothetical protein